MITILVPGKVIQKQYLFNCKHCGCIFKRYLEEDGFDPVESTKNREELTLQEKKRHPYCATCPTCGYTAYGDLFKTNVDEGHDK